jgi:hypothetical protein
MPHRFSRSKDGIDHRRYNLNGMDRPSDLDFSS